MLRKSFGILTIVIWASISLTAQSTETKPPEQMKEPATTQNELELIEGKVTFVNDGDQFRVKTSDGKVYAIRIHGIDAPEQDQEYGVKSRKKLEDQILNKDIKVMVHRLDSQGRYIGTIFLYGQDIGLRLLENGSAWHYKRVSGEQSSDVRARYAKAELKAREGKTGLWSDAMPIPPWEFRDDAEAATAIPEKGQAAPLVSNPQPPAKSETKPAQVEGRVYTLGPRGGCYYLNSSGAKVYVKDKDLCKQR